MGAGDNLESISSKQIFELLATIQNWAPKLNLKKNKQKTPPPPPP